MTANPLFRFAAIFNFVVGGALLLAYRWVAPMLGIQGGPTVWLHLTALVVLVFGYAYWCVSRDPVRYRPYVSLGAIGKLCFVVAIYGHWLAGGASEAMALLVSADLVFAVLFAAYLRTSA